jgi:hypothetical protein
MPPHPRVHAEGLLYHVMPVAMMGRRFFSAKATIGLHRRRHVGSLVSDLPKSTRLTHYLTNLCAGIFSCIGTACCGTHA